MMGDAELNSVVGAQSPSDYVQLAVQLGNNSEKRNEAEQRTQNGIHRLYEKW